MRRSGYVVELLVCGLLLGCGGGDDPIAPPPSTDPSQLYWALALDHRAVTLSTVAPYDTLRLVPTPRNTAGEALPSAGTPSFTSSDPGTVRVDPDGLLHAVVPGAGVLVIVALQEGNLTRTDTAIVNVTSEPNPPTLAGLSIQPVPPDSAKLAVGSFRPWSALLTDPIGQPIPGLAIRCWAADRRIALVGDGCNFIVGLHPGQVPIVATATAYGVTKVDTLMLAVGYPLTSAVPFTLRHGTTVLGTVTIAVGGTASWINRTGQPADVTFDDPTNVAEDPACQCGAGDIAPFGVADTTDFGANVRSRHFPVAGTYPFHSAATQASGAVIVVDN